MSMNNRENENRRPAPSEGNSQRHQSRAPQPKRRPQRKKSEYRVFRALGVTIVLVVLCVFMAYFGLKTGSDLLGLNLNVFGLSQQDKEVTISIPEGSGVTIIADKLKEVGAVDSSMMFRLYSRIKDRDDGYKPGEYVLNCKMSYDQIMDALSSGSKERVDTVEVTLREGLTLAEIGTLLEENKVCDQAEFLAELEKKDYDYKFMQYVPKDRPLRFRLLEGYAFPDTYLFFVGENPTSVARKFLSNFNSKITDEMYTRMDELNMTLDDVITLASIIEEEASAGDAVENKRNMEGVSGVFHNRLAKGSSVPMLQSDVTYFYAYRHIAKYLTTVNQPMYDAYDTYKCAGLPVGPISNPGMTAIMAALYPEDNEYYYFLTDKESNFYYAITLAEHEKNMRTAGIS